MLDASDEGEDFMERLSMRIPENAAVILKGLSEAGYEAYVVGGCVRDSLLVVNRKIGILPHPQGRNR